MSCVGRMWRSGESYKQQIEELQEKCEDKQEFVDEERVNFMEFKRQVATGSVNSRSGRSIPAKVFTAF